MIHVLMQHIKPVAHAYGYLQLSLLKKHSRDAIMCNDAQLGHQYTRNSPFLPCFACWQEVLQNRLYLLATALDDCKRLHCSVLRYT